MESPCHRININNAADFFEDAYVMEEYKCTKNSPTNPEFSNTSPRVLWTHILCGEIVNNEAQGFHSMNPSSSFDMCAMPSRCKYYTNGNGYCRRVKVRNSDGTYIKKNVGSSLWPLTMTPDTLINMIVELYNKCNPPTQSGVICVTGCNYAGNTKKFDILLYSDNGDIATAYPRSKCNFGYQCTDKCKDL